MKLPAAQTAFHPYRLVLIGLFFLFFPAGETNGAEIAVDPAWAQIVVPPGADGTVRFAARELQRHLKMATLRELPILPKAAPGIRYTFLFERPPNVSLKPGEARWEVGEWITRFYGDSTPSGPEIDHEKILAPESRSGDLSAVYAFLEQQLKFLFIAPGDRGTSFPQLRQLSLTTGEYGSIPERRFRCRVRFDCTGLRSKAPALLARMPAFFRDRYRAYLAASDREVRLWLKKQRLSDNPCPVWRPDFPKWWSLYGKEHPEYFALLDRGRKPRNGGAEAKLCVSNPATARKVAELWREKAPRASRIDLGVFTPGDHCECSRCRALDAPPAPGREWDADLTDRYLFFAGNVAREARKHLPRATVIFRTAGGCAGPPVKIRVGPGVMIAFTPSMLELEKTEEQLTAWRRKGAAELLFQPQDLHLNTGLPLGSEKLLFDHLQTALRNGVTEIDCDGLHRFWTGAGAGEYILLRALWDPSKSFEFWLSEYCSAFGEAAPHVRNYFDYFRLELFGSRLLKNKVQLGSGEGIVKFRRNVLRGIGKYCYEHDFDAAGALLARGLDKPLPPRQKELLESLLLANYHAKLTFQAMTAPPAAKVRIGGDLLRFRAANFDKLDLNWYNLFCVEADAGDVAGLLQPAPAR